MQDDIRTQPALCWSACHYVFFSVVYYGGKTQICLKNQYHNGVSHMRRMLHNTFGLIQAQRCEIGTMCTLGLNPGNHTAQ